MICLLKRTKKFEVSLLTNCGTQVLRPPQRQHNARPPPQAIAPNTAGAAFAVKLSIPHLNRSSRMSASSLLLAWLAWLAFVCTSSADADVVAGTTSKCLDTCRTAGDGICQDEVMDGSDSLGRVCGVWCEFGTDCADCGPRLLVDLPFARRSSLRLRRQLRPCCRRRP